MKERNQPRRTWVFAVARVLSCLCVLLAMLDLGGNHNGRQPSILAGAVQVEQQQQSQYREEQQSHNCNYNIDRLKKGPVDWTKIEGTGKIFTDHSFPADQTMISWKEYPRTIGGLSKYLSWFKDFRRPRDLHDVTKNSGQGAIPPVSLFGSEYEKTGKMLDYGFEQGSLGDNYFLTFLAALSEIDGFIPSIFHQDKYNHEGIFALRVYVKGRPEEVTVDDLFPTYNNQPAFSKPSQDGGWWMPLIEKAYAKVNINYEMINSGQQSDAARFLTGAPSQDFETNTCTAEELWDSLALNLRKQHIITAACFNEFQGLQAGQGFIIKAFTKYTYPDGTVVRLLKVKNPWKWCPDGCKEGQKQDYTGRFSSKDSLWTEDLKQKAGFEKLRAGEFFMLVEDFKQAFKRYTVTQLKRDWKNSFVEKRNALNKKTYRFNFTIGDEDVNDQQVERTVQREMKQVAKANAQLLFGEAAQFEEKMENDVRFELPKQEKNFDIESIQEATEETAPANIEDVQLGAEVRSDGDDDGDEDGGGNEEDEDDEQQTSVAEQMETTSSSSSADPGADDESDLTQLDRVTSHKKSRPIKREAEIDLEQDLESSAAPGQAQAAAKPVTHKRQATSHAQTLTHQKWGKQPKLEAYIGAEVYPNRMYPTGCPSFQKLSIKLFKVEAVARGSKGEKQKLHLVDSQFSSNRDGFGFMLKNLTAGQYQLQVKKYSLGFDVYDVTARIYSKKNLKMIDVEEQEIKKAKAKQEKKKENVGGTRTQTQSSSPSSAESSLKQHFTKAGDQDTNEKRMIDIDPHTQIDMELHKQNIAKDVELEEVKQAEKGSSNGLIENIRGPLFYKLNKAVKLASDPRADQFFEYNRREFYYMKDAIDKKHGFYFLRVGSNSDQYDLSLKIKMFVKGDLVETTEKNEKLYVYKYPEDKFPGAYKLTTYCKIMPLKGKKTCDFLVPTNYHDRTYVYIQNKVAASLS